MKCPYCGGPHNLSKCPRWMIPPATLAALAVYGIAAFSAFIVVGLR